MSANVHFSYYLNHHLFYKPYTKIPVSWSRLFSLLSLIPILGHFTVLYRNYYYISNSSPSPLHSWLGLWEQMLHLTYLNHQILDTKWIKMCTDWIKKDHSADKSKRSLAFSVRLISVLVFSHSLPNLVPFNYTGLLVVLWEYQIHPA